MRGREVEGGLGEVCAGDDGRERQCASAEWGRRGTPAKRWGGSGGQVVAAGDGVGDGVDGVGCLEGKKNFKKLTCGPFHWAFSLVVRDRVKDLKDDECGENECKGENSDN